MTQRSTALFKVQNYKEEAAGALGASPSGSHPSLDPPGGTCAVPVASAVLSPRWTALGLRSDAASSTGKPPAPPPLEPTATEFARMAPGTACQEEGGGPISVAPETPCYPHGPSPTSAHARHSGCLLPTLGLLTWGGRAPGCRPPVALGGAAPGTGCPAGSPRPCPRRGPGRSTGSSAPPLPHSSGCKRPACTATWGKQESGGAPGEPGFPSRPPQTRKGLEKVLFPGSHFYVSTGRLSAVDREHSEDPTLQKGKLKADVSRKAMGEGAGHPRGPAETSVSNRNPSPTITWARPPRTPNLLPRCVSTSHQHCPSNYTYTHLHIYIFPSIFFVIRPPAPSPQRLLHEHGDVLLAVVSPCDNTAAGHSRCPVKSK